MDSLLFKVFAYWLFSSFAIGMLVFFVWGENAAAGSFAGSAVVGINLMALIWAWQRIYRRKGLALAGGVIVFKYAFLGISIYWLIVHDIVNPFGFLVGSGVLLIILGLVAIEYKRKDLNKKT